MFAGNHPLGIGETPVQMFVPTNVEASVGTAVGQLTAGLQPVNIFNLERYAHSHISSLRLGKG
jgi:hypothetical protein